MNLLPLTQAMVGKFGEYYDEDYVKEEKFYHIQSELGQYVKLFNSEWDYSLQQPEHLEMWRFVTDHLIRWLTIPNVRYDLERTQTTVDALRCVTRMNCAKKQFDDWITVYKITRFYITNDKIQLKSLNLLYNLCLDENNKQTFITTKIIWTRSIFFLKYLIWSEFCRVVNQLIIDGILYKKPISFHISYLRCNDIHLTRAFKIRRVTC